jgi:hypothetical protein
LVVSRCEGIVEAACLHDNEHLWIGDLDLVLSLGEETIHRTQSMPDGLVLVKDSWLVEDNLARMPQPKDSRPLHH